ncbi:MULTISPECIES: vWA domain-containing protein [Calothrix]|uniref:VWA domain-containing protein n=2 Tax=Calothrix TaxID=1186 RepID=A0ABR8A6J2_9CYAN|nr:MULTISPECIES: vWA domain-containing protein [Calothrix]MBD2195244.1 VWA domain-containing protein [Calothrix parietina FACHB-288]MBD2223785.1 VWA domain-containing protein [Calothrix anomala FACHB-343]
MVKNFIALCFTIASSIRNNKLGLLAMLLTWIPTPLLAANGSVEILNYQTDGDRVILKVRVLDQENQPVSSLKRDNFQIKTIDEQGKTASFPVTQVISPELAQPDPAKIVILLDMSGSMQQRDANKVRKLNGATQAIREILQQLRKQNLPYEIAIVPFGFSISEQNCALVYDVSQNKIQNSFRDIKDTKLDNEINQLAAQNVCAATNLYQPVAEAVKFLGTGGNSPQNQDKIKPRLAVILLSDGYHVVNRPQESQQFESLRKTLQQYSTKVTVHTLGYGENLQELRDRTKCPLKDNELTVNQVSSICKIPKLKPEEFIFEAMQLIAGKDNQYAPPTTDINTFIVDEQRLNDIAKATGGLYKFSKNSQDVANSLITFFKTLREYEVTYKQTDAQQATQYKTIVTVTSPERNFKFSSPQKQIRLNNIGFQAALSWHNYLIIIAMTFAFALAWFIIFWRWTSQLRSDSERAINN